MNQSQDAKRHESDQQHRTKAGSLNVEVERNRSVNHLSSDTIKDEALKKIDNETSELMKEQGPTSFRRESN
ncbi:hypothetical protein MITS9509_01003 [Synechococcus sp. MIT S9509]|uniref:hypothetical protein n=1 Tax=Synechococcus sp. MIT S9504 TaxID=1801628 RepID=UPI0007BB57BA|nr:hypothetical protein [Synechococcus sp. MIT S9504]KZR87151.1 hypothetical protein MITS9504_00567 [Synechococcus sp. MIT S9504]KZR92554.1 hypothetical protein MITS9509_01003 [Synechococcus sp. MIT S9509]